VSRITRATSLTRCLLQKVLGHWRLLEKQVRKLLWRHIPDEDPNFGTDAAQKTTAEQNNIMASVVNKFDALTELRKILAEMQQDFYQKTTL
jgi:hypothetical protein